MIAAVPLLDLSITAVGRAVWTFIRGAPFYHCESKCAGFMQMELDGFFGVEQITRGDDTLDAGRLTPIADLLSQVDPHGS